MRTSAVLFYSFLLLPTKESRKPFSFLPPVTSDSLFEIILSHQNGTWSNLEGNMELEVRRVRYLPTDVRYGRNQGTVMYVLTYGRSGTLL